MSQRQRVLIVGAGSIGERHLRCFQATGRVDATFVEIDDARRAAISKQYGVVGFSDLAAAAHDIDLAVVATPADRHVEIATELAEAGVHVLIEKPLSTRTDGIDRLAQIAFDRDVVIAVAYIFRCIPALVEMRDALLSGRFGKPVQIVAVSGQNFPTYRPAYRNTYHADRATGGGAIQDALTHPLNAGEWLVGPIDRLVADAAHQVLEGITVEDTVHVLARHGDVLGSYSLNQHQAPNELTLTVICERGTLRWEWHQHRWRWMTQPDEPWHDEPHEPRSRDADFITQAHRFLDAVADAAPPPCTLDDGAQTLRVALAALASIEDRSWQTVATHAVR